MKKALVCVDCEEVSWSEEHIHLLPFHKLRYEDYLRGWWTCIKCVKDRN